MPQDSLSKITIPKDEVFNFLLRHLIASPLLFDDLNHFQTGSIVPINRRDFMLRISNYGRRSFYLNNIQLISPNICTAGPPIRCHGINGVQMAIESDHKTRFSPPTSYSANPQSASAPTTPWTLLSTLPVDL
uniref:FAS1 domain-containing protein n=1 Tax=Nelumbo nucifera TaxID=4432 RepID=A0A822XGX1_NELNU|nr:TPA_asm: hypothetical protein HUJ06_020655 [Nelumbo nucifera]